LCPFGDWTTGTLVAFNIGLVKILIDLQRKSVTKMKFSGAQLPSVRCHLQQPERRSAFEKVSGGVGRHPLEGVFGLCDGRREICRSLFRRAAQERHADQTPNCLRRRLYATWRRCNCANTKVNKITI